MAVCGLVASVKGSMWLPHLYYIYLYTQIDTYAGNSALAWRQLNCFGFVKAQIVQQNFCGCQEKPKAAATTMTPSGNTELQKESDGERGRGELQSIINKALSRAHNFCPLHSLHCSFAVLQFCNIMLRGLAKLETFAGTG